MKLINRLKQQYKSRLTKDCIDILSDYEYVGDMNIAHAQIVTYNLIGRSVELGLLMDLFYELKDIYNNYLIEEYDQPGFNFMASNLIDNEVTVFFGKTIDEIKEQINQTFE